MTWSTMLLSSRNYGPTVLVQQEAQKKGCEQVLWLYGPDHELTEVGTMNIFVFWTYEDGGEPTHDQPQAGRKWVGAEILRGCRSWGLAVSGEAPKRLGWCEVTRPLRLLFHLTQCWNW